MIFLDATTKSIELKMAAAAATTDPDYTVSYADISQTTWGLVAANGGDGVLTGTSVVTAVAAPGATTSRQLKYMTVQNRDTAAVTLVAQLNDAGAQRQFGRWSLAVNDTLEYTESQGFRVVDANGQFKQSITAAAAISTFTGAVVGTGTIPGGPVGMSFTANPSFTGTGTAAGWLTTGTSTGAMFSWGTATGGYTASGTSSAALTQGANAVFSGTGTAAGWLVSGTSTAAMMQSGTSTGGFSRWGTSSAALVQGQDAAFSGTGTTVGWLFTGTSTGAMLSVGTGTGPFSRWGTSSQTLMQATNVSWTGTGTGVDLYLTGTGTGIASRWGTASSVLNQMNSQSMTGTGTVGGIHGTRAVKAAIGSSASNANVVVSPYLDGTPVATTLAAGTYMRYGVPASAMVGSGQGLRWSMWGTSQSGVAQAAIHRWALVLGTGTLLVATSTTTYAGAAWALEGWLIQQAAAQQQFWARFSQNNNNAIAPTIQWNIGTLGMTLTTVTTLCIVSTGTTSNAKAQLGMIVEALGAQ